jgi:hypothetical protein
MTSSRILNFCFPLLVFYEYRKLKIKAYDGTLQFVQAALTLALTERGLILSLFESQ